MASELDLRRDITDQPDYREGIDWAVMHRVELTERYSSTNITEQDLRTYLFRIAERLYPHQREDPENDLRQTFFVAGAIRRIIDTIPFGLEAMREVFDMGMDIGEIYGAERWKVICFRELREKEPSWWRKKRRDASPNFPLNGGAGMPGRRGFRELRSGKS